MELVESGPNAYLTFGRLILDKAHGTWSGSSYHDLPFVKFCLPPFTGRKAKYRLFEAVGRGRFQLNSTVIGLDTIFLEYSNNAGGKAAYKVRDCELVDGTRMLLQVQCII